MLSKLIVHASTREDCIERMIHAIDNYDIRGVKTTLDFGRFAINHEAFRSGNFDTGFVNDHFTPEKLIRDLPVEDDVFASLVAELSKKVNNDRNNVQLENSTTSNRSPWRNREERF
jgi:propionyl-CoA carboxylase alpha chain